MRRPKPPSLTSPDYGSPVPGAPADDDDRSAGAVYARSSSDFGSPPRGGDFGRGRPGGRPRGPGPARQRAHAAGGGFGTDNMDAHDYGQPNRDERY